MLRNEEYAEERRNYLNQNLHMINQRVYRINWTIMPSFSALLGPKDRSFFRIFRQTDYRMTKSYSNIFLTIVVLCFLTC
jgi:hypothetical protein